MNKKGVTIIELLISISLISVVILLLIKVMFSLSAINNDSSYASEDELSRTEIIKNIEHDFLSLKLIGMNQRKNEIELLFDNIAKKLIVEENKLIYEEETYTLNSKNATYGCPKIEITSLDELYYLVTLTIPVLIEGENNTAKDDIELSYIGLKKENNSYIIQESC